MNGKSANVFFGISCYTCIANLIQLLILIIGENEGLERQTDKHTQPITVWLQALPTAA